MSEQADKRRTWKAGTFKTEELHQRLNELCTKLLDRAEEDKQLGNVEDALDASELVVCVNEAMRLWSNTINAHRETIRMLETQFETMKIALMNCVEADATPVMQ